MTNQPIIRPDDWVSVSDITKPTGVSRQAVHQAIADGKLRSIRLGNRTVLVHKRDAERYIRSKLRRGA